MTYQYRAQVERVIDGDTIVLAVDLGFGTWLRAQSFRLLGINAREKNDPGGAEARAHLIALLPPGTALTITSVKADKYGGRYDAHVILPNGTNLSDVLVQTEWAAAWSGAGARPLPPWPRKAT
jgi:endonuclease YncB( thermonuclease family)